MLKIKSIDDQHKQLFDIMNNLHEAVVSEHGKTEITNSIKELIKYTINHLEYEEGLLLDNGYVDYENHKKQHFEFINKIAGYDIELKLSGSVNTLELLVTTIDWLQNHILETDMRYRDFLIERGVV